MNVRVQYPLLIPSYEIVEADVGASEGEERKHVDSAIHVALGQHMGYPSIKFSNLASGLQRRTTVNCLTTSVNDILRVV